MNGDMRHGKARCSPVPVPLAGVKPHHIAGANDLHWTALALHASFALRHDQDLPQRMSVQFVRAPGWNVTRAPAACDGASSWNSGDIVTSPVNQSALAGFTIRSAAAVIFIAIFPCVIPHHPPCRAPL